MLSAFLPSPPAALLSPRNEVPGIFETVARLCTNYFDRFYIARYLYMYLRFPINILEICSVDRSSDRPDRDGPANAFSIVLCRFRVLVSESWIHYESFS